MDQMASLHGRAGHLVFLDTRSLAVEPVPFDPPSAGLALLVIDSRAPHALVDGEYAERRRSCEQAAAILGVPALRDVAVGDLDAALARLGTIDLPARRRVRHVVTENARVLDVVAALRAGDDPRTIGPALTASHASMRDDFEITVPEIDTAATAALDAGAHGARMTGGGFGGCVLALVDTDAVEPVVRAVEVAYDAAGFRPRWPSWRRPRTAPAASEPGRCTPHGAGAPGVRCARGLRGVHERSPRPAARTRFRACARRAARPICFTCGRPG